MSISNQPYTCQNSQMNNNKDQEEMELANSVVSMKELYLISQVSNVLRYVSVFNLCLQKFQFYFNILIQ